MTGLRAGAATVDITPPTAVMMDGYGDRRQSSQGVHDPLFARALVLEGSGEAACAIVGCDLLGIHPDITAEVRRRVEQATGIGPDEVTVTATHNHAGPYGLRGGLFSTFDEELAATVAEKITDAIAAAHGELRPATLKLGHAIVDTVSQNRRHPDWPIDPVLRVLLVDGEDGQPVASLLSFACHATVLSATNLMLSAEFPGAACRLVQETTGATAIYLNGACGNVNPTWIRQDFDSMQRVGEIIGGQALRLIGELRTLGPGQRAHNIRWDEFTEREVPGRIVEPRLRSERRRIELPLREFPADDEYASRLGELESELAGLADGSDGRRDAMARTTRLQGERWAGAWARRRSEKDMQLTEIQALLLGEGLGLLALPGEFFVETAETIRREAGLDDVFIVCYANDYVGYVIPPEAYDAGGYEPGVTPCSPEAEGIIVDASVQALQGVAQHAS